MRYVAKRWTFVLFAPYCADCPFVRQQEENFLVLDISDATQFRLPNDVKFCIAQVERAPTSGRVHIQGYIEFENEINRRELRTMRQLFGPHVGKVCFIAADGNRTTNVAYCSKLVTRIAEPRIYDKYPGVQPPDSPRRERGVRQRETGDAAQEPGDDAVALRARAPLARVRSADDKLQVLTLIETAIQEHNDFQKAYTAIKHKADASEGIEKEQHVTALTIMTQRCKFFCDRALHAPPPAHNRITFRHVSVQVVTGPTGTGKTWKCYERYGSAVYSKALKSKWWDGYNPERHLVVLLDEFSGDGINSGGYFTPNELQTICQGYPKKLESKGGHLDAAWKHVYIATNIEFDQWFKGWEGVDNEVKNSIRSRITVMERMDGPNRRNDQPRVILPAIEGVQIEYVD